MRGIISMMMSWVGSLSIDLKVSLFLLLMMFMYVAILFRLSMVLWGIAILCFIFVDMDCSFVRIVSCAVFFIFLGICFDL